MRQQLAVLLFVFFTGLVGGYLWGSGQEPDLDRVPIVRYLPFAEPRGFEPSVPDLRKEFRPLEREQVRVDTVEVPIEIERYVVATRGEAIQVSPREVQFRYFDHETRRWGIDVYQVPERRFGLGLYLDTFVWDFDWHDPTIGMILEARYRNLHLGIGPYYSVGRRDALIMLNFKYKIL